MFRLTTLSLRSYGGKGECAFCMGFLKVARFAARGGQFTDWNVDLQGLAAHLSYSMAVLSVQRAYLLVLSSLPGFAAVGHACFLDMQVARRV